MVFCRSTRSVGCSSLTNISCGFRSFEDSRSHLRAPLALLKRPALRVAETAAVNPREVCSASQGASSPPDHGGAAARHLGATVTLKTAAAIHWEALRLWLKGASGATSACRSRERQYQLGERRAPRLYWRGVICRRAGAGVAGKRSGPVKPDLRKSAHTKLGQSAASVDGPVNVCLDFCNLRQCRVGAF